METSIMGSIGTAVRIHCSIQGNGVVGALGV